MSWNPKLYNQFKEIRYKPFFDLAELISNDNLQNCVDIGCGTGEQTSILSQRFANSTFLGIDSSQEMLAESRQFENENLHFKLMKIEEFSNTDSTWDLIFSNAALQWSEDHEELFPKIISKLRNGGQLAVQMPFQKENTLNQILFDMASEKPFADLLGGFRHDSPLLNIDEYTNILFHNGLKDLTILLKVYPIIANSETDLFNFISGSALIPYLERLAIKEKEIFVSAYKQRIKKHFKSFPAIYPFKRILMHGTKE
jgi:trans-aconitate 2-methyltransferase